MKLKFVTVVLFLACVGLGIMLLVRYKEAQALQKTAEDTSAGLASVSNQLQKTSADLAEHQQVNDVLTKTVKTRDGEVVVFSNKVTEVKGQLEKTEADAKAKEQAAQAELAKRDTKITELEGQKDDMSKRLASLTNKIANLESKITDTERKLAVSEGDREFLLKELKRLQTEKAELDRQFNDLQSLKVQVGKLKEELTIARRLDFFRSGVFSSLKGAERFMMRPVPAATKASTNFSLNVEFKQDGGARVVTPAETNAVRATNAPVRSPK